MDLATLGLEIRSDSVPLASRRLRDFEGRAGRAERSASALGAAFRTLTPIIAAAAAAFSFQALGRMSDEVKQLDAQLRLAVGAGAEFTAMQDRLFQAAQSTNAEYGATVNLFARLARSTGELGISNERLAQVTETVNRAFVVSGASAQEAQSAIFQLSQGIAAGALRGEEFNSIMEQGPRLAKAIADGMGVAVGDLRGLAEEGKLTAEVIIATLESQAGAIEREFGTMDRTIGMAMTNLGNEVLRFVGVMDSMSGMSGGIVTAIDAFAASVSAAIGPVSEIAAVVGANFERILYWAGAVATFMSVQWVAGFVAARIATFTLVGALTALKGAIMRTGIGLAIVAAGELVYQFMQLVEKTGGWGSALSLLGEVAAGVWDGISTSAKAIEPGLNAVWEDVKAGFLDMLNFIGGKWRDFLNHVAAGLSHVPGGLETARTIATEANRIDAVIHGFTTSANRARSAAAGLREESAGFVSEGFEKAAGALSRLNEVVNGPSGNVPGTPGSRGRGGGTDLPDTPDLPDLPDLPGSGSASAQANAYEQATQRIREQTQALQDQQTTFGMTEEAASRFTTAMELVRAAEEAGIPITSGLIDEINGLAGAYAQAEEAARLMKEQQQFAQEINNTLAQGFSNLWTGIIDGSKSAGEAVAGFIKQLGSLFINNAFQMLFGAGTSGGIGGWLSGIFMPNALGGVYDSPGLSAYSNQVVSSPTLFPFAKGIGLMGEAGPEAIMPLTRGPNGRLGVQAHANQNQNNDNRRGDINITINGSGLSEQQLARAIGDALTSYDSSLAGKVENKVRTMQRDPRAADGGW